MEVVAPEQQMEREKRRQNSDKISSLIGQYLLKGWRMLEDCCQTCDTILLMNRDGVLYCVGCSEVFNNNSPSSHNFTNNPEKLSGNDAQNEASAGDNTEPTFLKSLVDVGLDAYAPAKSNVNLQTVDSVLQDKIFFCSQRLAKSANLEEIQQLSTSIKTLSDALFAVRKCLRS